jgi:hypothetical protein
VAAIVLAKAYVEPSTSSSRPILPRPGGWRLNAADTAAGATNASVGRSAWQVASRIGALVLDHHRFLCGDRDFEPPALSRFAALPAQCLMLCVLTGSLAPCSWLRHGACGGTVRLAVHSGARARPSAGVARALSLASVRIGMHTSRMSCNVGCTLVHEPRVVFQTSVS